METARVYKKEVLKVFKEVYAMPHVQWHCIAAKELRNRGIKITSNMAARVSVMYKVPRPFIKKGNPHFEKEKNK